MKRRSARCCLKSAKAIKDQSVAQVWATRVGPLFQWNGNNWSAGPSATPTVDGELIFARGGMGDLVCVNAADGAERWRKNLPQDFQPRHRFCGRFGL